MSNTLEFHKCKICGDIFYSGAGKYTYCTKCVPRFHGQGSYERLKTTFKALNDAESIEKKRAKERERWHRRMANPVFREHERLRSLARARADKKYAKEVGDDSAD